MPESVNFEKFLITPPVAASVRQRITVNTGFSFNKVYHQKVFTTCLKAIVIVEDNYSY